jgi:hypothetical protein
MLLFTSNHTVYLSVFDNCALRLPSQLLLCCSHRNRSLLYEFIDKNKAAKRNICVKHNITRYEGRFYISVVTKLSVSFHHPITYVEFFGSFELFNLALYTFGQIKKMSKVIPS